MRLLAFRVREFRSVDDSGWIDPDQVAALIGTNESGKTNILVPLWKLKPVKDGAIGPLAHYPRKRYHEIRAMKRKPVFIEARFELPATVRKEVARLLHLSEDRAAEATVSRDFDGAYYVSFHSAGPGPTVQTSVLLAEFRSATTDIAKAKISEDEEDLRNAIEHAIQRATAFLKGAVSKEAESPIRAEVEAAIGEVDLSSAPTHSMIAARFGQLVDAVTRFSAKVSEADRQSARALVLKSLPSFAYYSNCGNLDSRSTFLTLLRI
jgi:hypothetical protein